jgi:hypothetical protein
VHHDGQIGGRYLVLDSGQNVLWHQGIGVVVPPRRPLPVAVTGEHDATQVGSLSEGKPTARLADEPRQRGFESLGNVDVEHATRSGQQPDVGESHHFGEFGGRVHRAQRHRECADP